MNKDSFGLVDAALAGVVDRTAALPLPGGGRTPERLTQLADWAASDLSLGRLAEGHADARAILAEADLGDHHPAAAYGVWATRSRQATRAEVDQADWSISGTKVFCSGAGLVDRALVTADAADGYRLFDVDLSTPGVETVAGSWPAVGMAGSASFTVVFDDVRVAAADAVGEPGFYLSRPGFWFGAVGVAACWFGGARALVDVLIDGLGANTSEARLADLGRAVSLVRAQRDILDRAGRDIDADPRDRQRRSEFCAQAARQAVHDSCVEVLACVAAAGGARPLGHDGLQSQRAADLYVYLAQHHGGADAAVVGRMACDGSPWA